MRSKNTRVQLNLNTAIWNAVIAESEAVGFSLSEIVDRVLYDAGYGKPQNASKPAVSKGKELPPVKVWEGDPYNDPERDIVPGRRYSRPATRWKSYTIDKLSPKQIREREDLMKRKWPQAETVYDAGLADDDE